MDPKALAEIDRQIAQLKKELNVLFAKRIAILHDEIKRSEAEAQILGGGAPGSNAPLSKAKRSRPAKAATATESPAPEPDRSARQSTPPASPATVQPKEKEKETAAEPETASRAGAPEDESAARIWTALKEAALFGLSQAEISKLTGLRPALVGNKLKDLPGVTKKGSGRDARFYLKS